MRILFVCNDLPYFVAHRLFLASNLLEEGHEVCLATGGADHQDRQLLPSSLKVIPLKLQRHRISILYDTWLFLTLWKTLKSFKPHIVHCFTIKPNLFMGLALLMAQRSKAQNNPACVMTFPGLGRVFEPSNSPFASFRKWLVKSLLGIVTKRIPVFCTFENHRDQNVFVKLGITKIDRCVVMTGAGINVDFFQDKEPGDPPVVLFASRLIKGKGVGIYLNAANTLTKTFSEVKFQMAGPMEEKNSDRFFDPATPIENNINDVTYLGSVPIDEMPDLLSKADILCMPSRLSEGLPRIVLEAMASSCVCITSAQPALENLIVDGKTGLVLKENTAEELEKVLRGVLRHWPNAHEIGQKARLFITNEPVLESEIFQQFRALYDRTQLET